jgi:hypothetical protein
MGFHFHISLPHLRLPSIHLPHINIGKTLSGIEHAIGHAAHDVGKEAGHLAHEVGHAVGAAVHLAGHVLADIAAKIGDFALQLRPLRPAEIQVAQSVFLDTLPYDRVLISPLSGLGSRPFTVPGSLMMAATAAVSTLIPGIGAIVLSAEVLAGLANKYVIFMGSAGYHDALHHPFDGRNAPGQTLIHELTHVWQGYHEAFNWDYVYHSIKDQCSIGSHAYDYNVSRHPAWDSLRVESQARVVDHWFGLGRPSYGTLFDYVRDNIRAQKPHGHTSFPPLPQGYSDPGQLVSVG